MRVFLTTAVFARLKSQLGGLSVQYIFVETGKFSNLGDSSALLLLTLWYHSIMLLIAAYGTLAAELPSVIFYWITFWKAQSLPTDSIV